MTRTQLIHSIVASKENGEFISKCLRGNTLWSIWKKDDHFIICDTLVKGSDGWTYVRQDESSPPNALTCPKNYLTKAEILCKDWRRRVSDYANKNDNALFTIRELFDSKKEGEIVQVTIRAKKGYIINLHDFALEEAMLDILSVIPFPEGRFHPNGLRYQIPLRLVSDVSLRPS